MGTSGATVNHCHAPDFAAEEPIELSSTSVYAHTFLEASVERPVRRSVRFAESPPKSSRKSVPNGGLELTGVHYADHKVVINSVNRKAR